VTAPRTAPWYAAKKAHRFMREPHPRRRPVQAQRMPPEYRHRRGPAPCLPGVAVGHTGSAGNLESLPRIEDAGHYSPFHTIPFSLEGRGMKYQDPAPRLP